jgi:hypothetical protein
MDSPASPKSKIEVLRENGIAPQTANRYERLAGGSDPEIREKVHTASDQYFERCLEEGKTPKVAELTEIVDGICGLAPEQRLTPIEKQKGAMVSVLRKICKSGGEEDLESHAHALADVIKQKDLATIVQFDRFWKAFIDRCQLADHRLTRRPSARWE